MRDPESTIGKLIDYASTAFISSVDADGFPNTKAMLAIRERDGIQKLYFSTNTSSMRVAQYSQNPKACVYFMDKRFFRGVMLRGHMRVLTDEDSRQRLWREGDEKYYPEGLCDPDYCVLEFTAQDGRFYRNFQSENFEV